MQIDMGRVRENQICNPKKCRQNIPVKETRLYLDSNSYISTAVVLSNI